MSILTELQDPRIQNVTVTMVEVAPDMRTAKVHVSVMGDLTKQNLSLRGLQNSSGFLQQRIAKRIDTRYTPKLTFVLDQGVKHSLEVARILDEVLPEQETSEQDSSEEYASEEGRSEQQEVSQEHVEETPRDGAPPEHKAPPEDDVSPASADR